MTMAKKTAGFTNLSTQNSFRFVFHCELCGAGVKSEKYSFNTSGYDPPPDKSSRALLWTRQHSNAFDRAYEEAQFDFNTCPVCGRSVCVECFAENNDDSAGICEDCRTAEKHRTAPS